MDSVVHLDCGLFRDGCISIGAVLILLIFGMQGVVFRGWVLVCLLTLGQAGPTILLQRHSTSNFILVIIALDPGDLSASLTVS